MFLPISFKIQLLENSPQKQKEQRQKQLDVSFSDVFSLPVHLELFASFSYGLHYAKFVCLETAETETGMAEKSSWDQANIRQKLGWFGEIERKLAKLSKTTFIYRFSS
jgi:hypothetical protein